MTASPLSKELATSGVKRGEKEVIGNLSRNLFEQSMTSESKDVAEPSLGITSEIRLITLGDPKGQGYGAGVFLRRPVCVPNKPGG
jgi:hypothetical protein